MSFRELMSRVRWYDKDRDKAGFGPLSNGIPEAMGKGGESEASMPPPIGHPVRSSRDTVPMRKVAP